MKFKFPILLIISVLTATGQGWRQADMSGIPIPVVLGQQQQQQAQVAPASLMMDQGFAPMSLSVVDGVEDITPELQAIARGLGHDPVKIYEWVKNSIDYVPYGGVRRGAHLTAIERAGNDFDTSALLVALLKASGFTDVEYRFGLVRMPTARADKQDVEHWLGVDKTQAAVALARAGVHYQSPYNLHYSLDFATVTPPRVWVSLRIDGVDYVLDPSFKSYKKYTPIDLNGTIGYSSASVLNSAGGALSGVSYTMGTAGRDGLKAALNTYASALYDYTKNNAPSMSGLEASGGRVIDPVSITGLPTALPSGFEIYGSVVSWESIPQNYVYTFTIDVGDISYTLNAAELRGRKLAIWFNSGRAELWLDDQKVAEETTFNASQPASIDFSYYFPVWNKSTSGVAVPLTRNGAYVIAYGFGRVGDRIKQRNEKLSAYVAAGESSVGRKLISENLYIAGIQYQRQAQAAFEVVGGMNAARVTTSLFAGVVGQSASMYMDFPIMVASVWPDYYISGTDYATIESAGLPTADKVFSVATFFASAFEHIGIEQVLPNAAASTVKMVQSSVDLGNPVYLVKNTSEYNSIKSQLLNYPGAAVSAATVQQIESDIAAGGRVLLPKNNAMPLGDYSGTGYAKMKFYSNTQVISEIAMMIGGGYSGGYSSESDAKINSEELQKNEETAPQSVKNTPETTVILSLGDPVDAATGAFYLRENDLAIGGDGPSGLLFTRHYSTARVPADPVGLGRGWTHSYNIELNYRTPTDLSLERATVAELAPYIVAAKAAYDVFNVNGNAKEWTVPMVVTCWLGEQLVKSRATIAMGESTLEFTKLPNGSFAPPAKVNASFVRQGDGSHLLKFRKGSEILFRAVDGKFTSITDRNTSGNTPRSLTALYNGDATLYRVTDSFNRYFQFSYSGGKLTGVSDSTGRNVSYGSAATGAGQSFTYTDPEGKMTRYLHDDDYRITEVRDALGRTTIVSTFDDWARVDTQLTFGQAGRLWKYGYAPGITRYEDPEGNASWFYFDSRGRSVAKINELGQKSVTNYDGADREVSVVTPLGYVTTFGYDKNHDIISVTNAKLDNRVIIPASDDSTTTPRTEYDFEGKATVTTYYSYHLPKDVTIPGGLKTEFEYDTRGRISRSHPPAFSADEWIEYTYDDSPGYTQRITVTYPDGSTEISNFNARGDLIQSIDRRGKKTTFAYNLRRQVTETARWTGTYTAASPVGGTPPPGSLVTVTEYDDAGNMVSVLDPLLRSTDYEYNALGKLTSVYGPDGTLLTDNYYDSRNLLATTFNALGHQTDFEYDAASRTEHVLDPLGRSLRYGYDDDGRQITVTSAQEYTTTTVYGATGLKDSMVDALNNEILYTYDKDGRSKALTNRLNNTYTTDYDDANRVTTTRTPLLKPTVEERNTRGLVTKVTQPLSNSIENTVFDAEGRVLTQVVRAPNGTIVATTQFTYYTGGLLHTVIEGGVTTTRTYDDFGRLYSYDDGEGHSLGYRYDAAGNLHQLIYPDGKTVTYGYDDYNRLETVTDWANRVTSYTYDIGGRLVRTDRPNGTWRKHVYDAGDQLRQIEEYDANDNVLWLQALKYDIEGQIKWTYTYPTPAAFTLPTDSADHDADNRISLWAAAGGASIAPVFDDNGNMTSGPDATTASGTPSTVGYVYDYRNRLTSAAGQTYRYNPDGHRVQVNATTYVVDPAASLSRVLVKNPGATATYYVWGHGLVYEETAGVIKTYHPNHQGSTVLMADGAGAVTDRVEYAPYGAITYRSGSSTTPFLLHGALGVMVDANGLAYMRARYYHPRLMRFLNADPIGFAGGMNWYAFANGNPMSYVDPSGYVASDPASSVSSVVGGAPLRQELSPQDILMIQQYVDGTAPVVPLIDSRRDVVTTTNIVAAATVVTAPVVLWRTILGRIGLVSYNTAQVVAGNPEDVLGVPSRVAAQSATTWATKPRGKPGADGGLSTYATEVDSAGRTVSTRHTVTRDGQVVHQHQTHVGSSGSTRSFPDEWTGTKTVNERPVDPHYVPQGPVLPNVGPDAVPGR